MYAWCIDYLMWLYNILCYFLFDRHHQGRLTADTHKWDSKLFQQYSRKHVYLHDIHTHTGRDSFLCNAMLCSFQFRYQHVRVYYTTSHKQSSCIAPRTQNLLSLQFSSAAASQGYTHHGGPPEHCWSVSVTWRTYLPHTQKQTNVDWLQNYTRPSDNIIS